MYTYHKLAAAALLLLPALAAHAADESYTIKFDRAVQPGDAFELRILASNTEALKQTLPGAEPTNKSQAGTGELNARLDVIDVDPDGLEKTFTLTVKSLTIGILALPALPPGKIIKVTRTDKAVSFTVDGKELSGEPLAFLQTSYAPLAEKSSVDALVGSKTPRKVGESWPFDAAAIARRLSSPALTIPPESLKGNTTLKAVETVQAAPALRLITSVSAEINPNTPVDGGTLKTQAAHLEFEYLLPVNLPDPILQRVTSIIQTQTFSLTNPAGATVETAAATSITQTYTPIHPALGMPRNQIPAKFKPTLNNPDTLTWTQPAPTTTATTTQPAQPIQWTLTLKNDAIANITKTPIK